MKSVNCAVCGSAEQKMLFVSKDYDWGFPGNFSVSKCVRCGFVFTSPRPDDDEIKNYYPEEYHPMVLKEELSGEDKAGLNFFFGFRYRFLSRFKKEGKLLDVGTGEGMFLKLLRDNGWKGELAGVEPSKKAAAFARERLGLNVMDGDLKSLDIQTGQFDVVTMWEVMEHLPDPNENLKEIFRILKDDGIFLASVPNFNSIQSLIFGRWWYGLKTPVHLSHFTPRTMSMLLRNNGFEPKIYHSLINLKKPVTGYSDSLRYLLTDLNLYPKRAAMIKKWSGTGSAAGASRCNSLPAKVLHYIEFIIFGAIELASLPFGRTATIFVMARKR
jgi:2-polyprenyl-3-methyl-5-hydroxy-6-metoxy-1,4-benzoquinol methylase